MSQAIASDAKSETRLTDRQKRLADMWMAAKVAGADFNTADLAEAAGYSGTKDALYVAASRTLALPYVREYLHSKAREHLMDGAVDVAITLRALSTKAVSERVRADTAARLATGLRLIDGEQADRGPAVAIQLVFRTDAGAQLAQSVVAHAEPQAIRHVEQVEHSLAKGAGGAKAPRARRSATPPPGQPQHAPGGAGVEKPARKSVAGSPPRRASAKVVPKKIGVVKKPRGGPGV